MGFNSKKEKAKPENSEGSIPKAKTDDEEQYVAFNMPWSFRFDYSLSYSNSYKPKSKPSVYQSLNMNGQLSITEKWQTSMTTNFDIQALKFQLTTITVSRTLHCWSMSFNFVPFGDRKSYSFTLSASSAMFRDLKVAKQSSWRDNN
jgi:hypothetical protein